MVVPRVVSPVRLCPDKKSNNFSFISRLTVRLGIPSRLCHLDISWRWKGNYLVLDWRECLLKRLDTLVVCVIKHLWLRITVKLLFSDFFWWIRGCYDAKIELFWFLYTLEFSKMFCYAVGHVRITIWKLNKVWQIVELVSLERWTPVDLIPSRNGQ